EMLFRAVWPAGVPATDESVADAIGLTSSEVQAIRSGRLVPSSSVLVALAEHFMGFEPAYLTDDGTDPQVNDIYSQLQNYAAVIEGGAVPAFRADPGVLPQAAAAELHRLIKQTHDRYGHRSYEH
ncbi:MAG: helix-turn-helix transcriptional regulator, partial [Nocardiaceae bacterium]|nr:helix-turn-helix transcriptional regulator [Nocardiaceae bacterium]